MTSLFVTSHNSFCLLINAWIALILTFFRYAGSSQSKKSACNISGAANTKKSLYFESFISGGVTALLKEISLKFKMSYLL